MILNYVFFLKDSYRKKKLSSFTLMFPGSCYKVNLGELSWVQALKKCESEGASLATQYSDGEYKFVYGKIIVYYIFYKSINSIRK